MTGTLLTPGRVAALNAIADDGVFLGLAIGLSINGEPSLATIQEVITPGYSRESVVWTDAADSSPPKITNSTDITFGPMTTDMPTAYFAFITDVLSGNAIEVPLGVAVGSISSGGSAVGGNYTWVVTAINSRGETLPSTQVSAAVGDGQKATVSWTTVSGATGYRVYRFAGTNMNEWIASSGTAPLGLVTSFVDTFDVGSQPAGSPPTQNTASVGDILYMWELSQPVKALATRPVYVPANGLVIE